MISCESEVVTSARISVMIVAKSSSPFFAQPREQDANEPLSIAPSNEARHIFQGYYFQP